MGLAVIVPAIGGCDDPGPDAACSVAGTCIALEVVPNLTTWSHPQDPFTLDGIGLIGDELELQIGFSGGCREHTFRLGVAESWGESQPPTATASLGHDSDGDLCEAFLRESLRVDLTPLQVEAARQFGTGQRAVRIQLVRSGADTALGSVLYEF